MTYTSETNLSASIEAEVSTTEKIKTLTQEGKKRTQRISQILKQAFSETREEFQAGRTVISPLAKEVTSETVSTFKSKSKEAADAVNKAWQEEADAPDTTERLINAIKKLLSQAKTTVLPPAKQQAIKVDEVLSNRYGTQYTTFRNRFKTIRSWVAAQPTETVEEAPSTASTVIEVDSQTIQ